VASSYRKFTFDGTTANVAVTFGYLDQSHVSLKVDGVLIDPSAYTWTDEATIHITAGAPVNGTPGEVRRTTPGDPLTEFQPGNLDSSDLNYAILQALFVAAEAADRQGDSEAGGWITAAAGRGGTITKGGDGDVAMFDADGNIIPGFDVADIAGAAAAATDAVNASIQADISEANAAASASLAQQWANNPEDSVVSGGQYSAFHWAQKAYAYVVNALSTTIHGYAEKTPVDADEFLLLDSAASFAPKKGRWGFGFLQWLGGTLLLDFMTGFVPAYSTTTAFTVGAGFGFFGGKKHFTVGSTTCSLAAVFGSGSGCLDTGVLQASKTYFVYAVRQISTGNTGFVASLSATEGGVNMTNLTGWEVLSGSRVGCILTNSSGQIMPFVQDGNQVRTVATALFTTGSSAAWALFTLTTIPIGISVRALISASASVSNAAGSPDLVAYVGPSTVGPTTVLGGCTIGTRLGSDGSDRAEASFVPVTTNTSGQLARSISGAGSFSVSFFSGGWIDYQCKRLWG
jgi:hypothetical protein